MFSRWLVRYQMYFGVATLLVIVGLLSFSSFQGVFKFRKLTKSIRVRATELPLAAKLNQEVCDLRVTLSSARRTPDIGSVVGPPIKDTLLIREQFHGDLAAVHQALEEYRTQLLNARPSDDRIADISREQQALAEIDRCLTGIDTRVRNLDWVLNDTAETEMLLADLEILQGLTAQLPGLMKQRMDTFAEEARTEYRAWIFASGLFTAMAMLLLFFLVQRFNRWIFKPLHTLLSGSRRVAGGDFAHRIELSSKDELAELSDALNAMTNRFCEIRDDLDRQVQLRTKEVVRGEQLASVGFLAAGVAHEINNPLASIAWAAESLESRLMELIEDHELDEEEEALEEVKILTTYLRRIQDEAFRCKGITDNLLDFSRMGDVERQTTNFRELVEGVIDMVQHLGKYREKNIRFECSDSVAAPMNAQEIKQVVLNLITNGLDSLNPGGEIVVSIHREEADVVLLVRDNGCGMTDDVMKHIFEPFFTRRRDGQGTGLGLSITYQIIADHGGSIEVESPGPGCGSTFRVTLPLVQNEEKKQREVAAA